MIKLSISRKLIVILFNNYSSVTQYLNLNVQSQFYSTKKNHSTLNSLSTIKAIPLPIQRRSTPRPSRENSLKPITAIKQTKSTHPSLWNSLVGPRGPTRAIFFNSIKLGFALSSLYFNQPRYLSHPRATFLPPRVYFLAASACSFLFRPRERVNRISSARGALWARGAHYCRVAWIRFWFKEERERGKFG